MCIKLVGVACASARELREDYGDFLRQKELETWEFNDPRSEETRRCCITHDNPKEFGENAELNESIAEMEGWDNY